MSLANFGQRVLNFFQSKGLLDEFAHSIIKQLLYFLVEI